MRIVRSTYDDDDLDDQTLDELFEAIYDRPVDDDDRENGLWSLVCAATPGLCGCATRRQHEDGGCRPAGDDA